MDPGVWKKKDLFLFLHAINQCVRMVNLLLSEFSSFALVSPLLGQDWGFQEKTNLKSVLIGQFSTTIDTHVSSRAR